MLMLLGVVLHSALPYTEENSWLIADPHRFVFFDDLTRFIHLFRMPAFFLIAGYFSVLLLRKRGSTEFMRERLRRIGIPLLATLFTLNLLQLAWLTRGSDAPVVAALSAAWHDGHWVGHLWFLSYLLGFCLVATLFAPLLRRSAFPAGMQPQRRVFWLVALGAMACVAPRLLWHWFPQLTNLRLFGNIDPVEWLGYLPYFVAGMLLQGDNEDLMEFSGWRLHGVLLAAAAAGATMYFATTRYHIIATLSGCVLSWMLVRFAFAASRRWCNQTSPAWRYLSDASYSIYLFHHLVVIVVASLLIPLDWNVAAKFLLVLCLSAGLSLAAHHFLVLRMPWLRYLFNGKRMRDQGGRAPAALVTTSSAPRSP